MYTVQRCIHRYSSKVIEDVQYFGVFIDRYSSKVIEDVLWCIHTRRYSSNVIEDELRCIHRYSKVIEDVLMR